MEAAGQKKITSRIVIQVSCAVILFFLLCNVGYRYVGEDIKPILKWWGALAAVGIAFYPLTAYVFRRFSDKGYLFGKAIGMAITGWLMWLLASCHVLRFTQLSCWLSLALCVVLNYGLFGWYLVKTKRVKEYLPPVSRIVWLELIFFGILLAFCYMKGFNPKAFGTEKMMDYGFMSSMYLTDYFPVNDFWFTGQPLNYYYFGQYLMTFMTKLSYNTVELGYNLSLGMGFTLCIMLVFSLVYQVMREYVIHCERKAARRRQEQQVGDRRLRQLGLALIPYCAGILSAVAVTLAGNVHYIIFAKIVPTLWDILQIPGEKPSFWFPDSTRYIGYMPENNDKTIHEFPSYSFILGDVHAHVINITFVLTVLAILFVFLMNRGRQMRQAVKLSLRQVRAAKEQGMSSEEKEREKPLTADEKPDKGEEKQERVSVEWKKELLQPTILLFGFFIGIFMMTNFWDFPIYFVVAGAMILVSNAVVLGFHKQTLYLTAAHAAEVLLIASLVALPFTLSFTAMANGLALAPTHTPLYQLAILWGLPILTVLAFLISLYAKEEKRRRAITTHRNPFFAFLQNLSISDLYILILGLCAIGLILVPEVLYIVDIYGGSYKRSNTMFKLTYQAYILFGIGMGYILTRFILMRESKKQLRGGIIALLVLLMTCGYFGTSVKAWFGDISKTENYSGLNAADYIYKEQPEDAAAIDWLEEHVKGTPVVLEANGDSYTIYNRVSVLTGLPTVLGWHTHEWLWNNDLSVVDLRVDDVFTLYTSHDQAAVQELLEKYDVSYIFVGSCEYEKYNESGLDVEFLKSLGEVVYEGAPDEENQTVYIIEVAR